MSKKNLSKHLSLFFEICQSDLYSNSSQPALTLKNSNYDLSRDEILRAKLMPQKLTLDNRVTYVKIDEEAYLNRSKENMLKVKYSKV
jgi:hypothetical protein